MTRFSLGDRVRARHSLFLTGLRVAQGDAGTVETYLPRPRGAPKRYFVKWSNGERGWVDVENLTLVPRQGTLLG